MITDLFDMFNRTHTGNSDQDRKDFLILVTHILTDMGGGLYTYLLMLENQGRDEEYSLIKEYREKIFGVRDGYGRWEITEAEVIKEIRYVFDKLSTQTLMLRTVEGRQWEGSLFKSTLNDMLTLCFHLENISSMKIPQRVN